MHRASRSLQRWLAPEVRYHQDTYSDVLETHVPAGGRWLDLGCGHRLLPEWHADRERDLVGRAAMVFGLDYDLPSLRSHPSISFRSRGDVSALPFADTAFDLVTANMVVEHLQDPERQFREVHRVLRPGGVFLFHTPNAHGYHTALARALPDPLKKLLASALEGRGAADIFPTFYRANSDADIRRVAAATGFTVDRLDFIPTLPALALVPPLAAIELLYIRRLERARRFDERPNLIVALRRPHAA